jgi:serine/threonine protein kinase/Flp pilus assembly protein TadD
MNQQSGETARHKAVLAAVLAVQRGFVSPEEAVQVLADLSNGGADVLLAVTPGNVAAEIDERASALAADPRAAEGVLLQLGLDKQAQSTLFTFSPGAPETSAATKAMRSIVPGNARTTGLADKVRSISARLPRAGENDRYTVKREYARGGMGRILIAQDNAVGREVALKELLLGGTESHSVPASTSSPELVERFLREAKVTGQLEHPNIVPVYEIAARDDGTVFYTMKLVRGKTMAHRLQQIQAGAGTAQQKMAERLKLLDAYVDVCNAIAYAHSRGVIHRDIKPANIMLGDFGETLVLDWGLARVQGQQDSSTVRRKAEEQAFSPSLMQEDAGRTLDGAVLGTPAYMPPEQARGELDKVDERADVYALGGILYELLAGRPPYEGANARDVLARVLVLPPDPLAKVAAFAPPDLVSLAEKAMARDPEQRLKSAAALATEVLAFRDGRELSVYRYSGREQIARFVKRHTAAVAVASIALLLGLSGGAYAFHQVTSERDQATLNLQEAEREREARIAAEARQENERAEQVRLRREEVRQQASRVKDLRGDQLRDEARMRIAELEARGTADSGLAPADRSENSRIVSGLLADAAASAELVRLIMAPVAGRSADLATESELSGQVSQLQDTRLLAAELALLNEDFALADFIIEGTAGSTSVLGEWRERVKSARSALLARHRDAVEAALEDVRQGLARGSRPRGNIRLEDYVIQLSAYREPQTVELLARALEPRIVQAQAETEFWSQVERDEITLACRVLGYLELPAITTPVLAGFMEHVDDQRLAIECGVALCQTASGHAFAPLLNARKRFGAQGYVWRRILRWFDRVPEPADMPEPATAAEYVERAKIRSSRKARGEALLDAERALELEPDNVAALTEKAGLSEIGNGIPLCERAIKLQPDYAPAYSVLANCRYQHGDFEEAVRLAQKAVSLDGTQAHYFLNLGFYQNRAGYNDLALESYARSLELDPFLPMTYTNRAAVYINTERFAEALEDLSRAIDLDPLHPEAFINRAVARREVENLNGALEDATRALELAPGHPWAVHMRGIVYHDFKREQEALADLNQVLPSFEQWFSASYATRAEVKLALGDKPGAVADYKRYLQLNEEADDRAEIEAKIAELEK